MNDIKRSYVIQWVGPFKSDNDVANYAKRDDNNEVCHSSKIEVRIANGSMWLTADQMAELSQLTSDQII